MSVSPSRRSRLAISTLAAAAIVLAATGSALAAPATSTTVHFSSLQEWGTPLGPTTSPSNCPATVLNDFVWINATGNGVMHDAVNAAGDFWGTSTFTGQATLTAYPASSLADVGDDAQGNTTATVVGPADATYAGHFTEWFGISDNKQNMVSTATIHFQGINVATRQPVSVNAVFHVAWLPGTSPSDPPSFAFDRATC